MSIFRFIMGCCILFVLYKGCDSLKKNGYHQEYGGSRTSEIYSLKTTSSISGGFVLGIGTVGSSDYYVFYRKTNAGGLIREKINASDCILYENSEKPMLKEIGTMEYHLVDGDTVSITFIRDEYRGKFYIFIPKGTITERIDNISLN